MLIFKSSALLLLLLLGPTLGAPPLDEEADDDDHDFLPDEVGPNEESEFIEDYIDDDSDLTSGPARGRGVKRLWQELFQLIVEKMAELIAQAKMGKKVVRLDNHTGAPLSIKCTSNKAKRHDVGPKEVADDHGFAFSFRSNIIRKSIVFRCDLSFKGRTKSLEVFGGSAPRKSNTYDVKPEGVYLGDKLVLKF